VVSFAPLEDLATSMNAENPRSSPAQSNESTSQFAPPLQRGVFCPVSGGKVENINVIAKEDMIEDVHAVYGDCTAEQVKRSGAVTLVEILIVDRYGNENLLDPITKAK
jgi:hypothetical protein